MNERLPFNPLQAQEVAGAFDAEAKGRAHHEDICLIANLRDISASKKATERMKDWENYALHRRIAISLEARS
jgi:hypothetical protein